jgi:hypothetical protein
MKSLLTLVILGMFSAGLVGCHASAGVGDSDTDSNGAYQKKTVEKTSPSGDTTYQKTTETRTTP